MFSSVFLGLFIVLLFFYSQYCIYIISNHAVMEKSIFKKKKNQKNNCELNSQIEFHFIFCHRGGISNMQTDRYQEETLSNNNFMSIYKYNIGNCHRFV